MPHQGQVPEHPGIQGVGESESRSHSHGAQPRTWTKRAPGSKKAQGEALTTGGASREVSEGWACSGPLDSQQGCSESPGHCAAACVIHHLGTRSARGHGSQG